MCISDLRLSFCQPQCDPGQTETEPCPQGAQAEGEDEAQVPAVKGETIRGLIRKVPLRSARARIQAETMVKAEVLSARLGLRLGVCAEIEHSSGGVSRALVVRRTQAEMEARTGDKVSDLGGC